MSHLDKTIDEDQNISINYIHEDAEWKKTHIVHEDITSSTLRNRKKTQLFLSALTRKLETRAHVTVSYEALNILVDIELSISSINEIVAFSFIKMFFNRVIVSQLNESKIKTIWIEHVLLFSKVQRVISFLTFDERNSIMMSSFTAKRF